MFKASPESGLLAIAGKRAGTELFNKKLGHRVFIHLEVDLVRKRVPSRVTVKVIWESGFQVFTQRRDSIPPGYVRISGHYFPS